MPKGFTGSRPFGSIYAMEPMSKMAWTDNYVNLGAEDL
jgi:hypothetical protein